MTPGFFSALSALFGTVAGAIMPQVVRLVAFADCFFRTAVKQEGRALTPDYVYSVQVPCLSFYSHAAGGCSTAIAF
jgi:hypothetical protein